MSEDLEEGNERDEEERPPESRVCPKCGSEDIRRRPRLIAFLAAAVIAFASGIAFDQHEAAFYFIGAAAIFALIADRWRCEECGETWK